MTETNNQGNAWSIVTRKYTGGVACVATLCTQEGGMMFSGYGSPTRKLAQEAGNATEARIKRVHEAGLLAMQPILDEEAKLPAPYEIKVGQILFSDGQLGREKDRAVCLVMMHKQYRTVLLDGSGFRQDSHVRDIKNKFGIGTYYNEGEVIGQEEVDELVAKATEATEREAKEKAEAEAEDRRHRAEQIALGSQAIGCIPAGARAIIVAEERENTSDLMSDYFGYRTLQTVYLAWSNNDRNNFSEMRDAANLFPATKHLATGGREVEHRENYSMGEGYYLGESKYSGWIVSKDRIPKLEDLQIAAVEDRFLCDELVQDQTQVPVSGTTVRLNPAKRGIEIYFPENPGEQVLANLKANGWNWGRRNRCWYIKDSSSARRFAKQYGFEDPAAEMVTAEQG